MHMFRKGQTRRGFIGTIGAMIVGVLSPRRARAENELIVLTGKTATVYQAGVSDLIPVTIKLTNYSADFIDMTYYATDSTGAAVSVSPSTVRHYLTDRQSVTDNVILSNSCAAGSVNFVALAQGENGGDGESYTQTPSAPFG